MSNVSIINVFNHIFLSEVILKIRIIKLKRTATTFLNLILLSSYNYLRRFIWFDYDASWHWTMVCLNWKFQGVLPIFSCKAWVKSVQYIFYNRYACMYVSINPFVYFKSQYYFTFFACFFCFQFLTFCFGTANIQIFCLKIYILFYCTESVNYIYQQISYACMLHIINSFNVLYFVYFLPLLLLQHWDIERNPGPQSG